MDVELEDERLPLLRASGRPSVLIGLPADTSGLTCVDLDRRATGALCVEHPAMLGHRDLAVIGEAPAVYERHTGFAERTLDGLRSRAGELGLRVLHRPCEGGYDAMAATLARILDERPDTTGFLVQNESAVEPLLALLRQRGRAVPEDVSVAAICPDQVAVQASVRLTSVGIPAQEMGRRAVERLVAKLDGHIPDEVLLLPPHQFGPGPHQNLTTAPPRAHRPAPTAWGHRPAPTAWGHRAAAAARGRRRGPSPGATARSAPTGPAPAGPACGGPVLPSPPPRILPTGRPDRTSHHQTPRPHPAPTARVRTWGVGGGYP